MADATRDLSIVTTLYRSAPFLDEFCRRVREAAERVSRDYEIVLVNDGSPDESLEIALALHRDDPRVRVVDLSRNFGHHKAMMTGLDHARGELVFLLDCDLEEDPAWLGPFRERLLAERADAVYGVQEHRKGEWFERLSGSLFFSLFNRLSTHPLPRNLTTARLMTRRYVASLVAHREREMAIGGLWVLTGYRQVAVPVHKRKRPGSSYGFGRKLAMAVDAVTSFSDKPLVLIFVLGCAIVSLSTAAAAYLIVRRLFFGVLLAGWPSLIVSIWLLGGLTLFCLGVIGIYLSKIFIETKQRPYTIVRELYEREE